MENRKSRDERLWQFILKRLKIDAEALPSVLDNFNELCLTIQAYDENFNLILKSTKQSAKHKSLLRTELKLYKKSIELRKKLNIYINDPCPNYFANLNFRMYPKTGKYSTTIKRRKTNECTLDNNSINKE